MYSVKICNSLYVTGKPVNSVIVAELEKLDDALNLGLALHRSSNCNHFVFVYDGNAERPIVTLTNRPGTDHKPTKTEVNVS